MTSAASATISDAAVIGAGPAGLTAALYLARFRRTVTVIEDGPSRAHLIPRSRNVPGFEGGVRGTALLRAIRRQIQEYGVRFMRASALQIRPDTSGFAVSLASETVYARSVLLATGVKDNATRFLDSRTIDGKLLRYCPICDGFEAIGLAVAVLGNDDHAAREALFLTTFTADVTLVPTVSWAFFTGRDELLAAGVRIADHPVAAWRQDRKQIELTFADQTARRFQRIYSALGVEPQSGLALSLGAATNPDGCILTDRHQQTNVPGIFAAGDVAEGLDQISVAFGQGATAATAIHNMLSKAEIVKSPADAARRPDEAIVAIDGQEEVFSTIEVALGAIEHKNGSE